MHHVLMTLKSACPDKFREELWVTPPHLTPLLLQSHLILYSRTTPITPRHQWKNMQCEEKERELDSDNSGSEDPFVAECLSCSTCDSDVHLAQPQPLHAHTHTAQL
jgi:hypothetical protein